MKDLHRKVMYLRDHLELLTELYKANPKAEWREAIVEVHNELLAAELKVAD